MSIWTIILTLLNLIELDRIEVWALFELSLLDLSNSENVSLSSNHLNYVRVEFSGGVRYLGEEGSEQPNHNVCINFYDNVFFFYNTKVRQEGNMLFLLSVKKNMRINSQ